MLDNIQRYFRYYLALLLLALLALGARPVPATLAPAGAPGTLTAVGAGPGGSR